MVTPETSRLFKLVRKMHRESLGTELEARYIGGWGDPRLLGCPEIVFYGPGTGGCDHAYDEYYELKDLAPVLKVLVGVALAWTGPSTCDQD